jgi:two-component system KDP operon response regulator KdpE
VRVSAPPVVLVVEDERSMRRFLRPLLSSHGFQVLEAATAADAVALATTDHPEIILLDLGLPDGDGMSLIRDLRGWSRTPIIVVSARDREGDKVEALDAGADDYLIKPFGGAELLARIRVALRHVDQIRGPDEPLLVIGGLRIDRALRAVSLDGVELHLTPIEYRLLTLLARHAGKVLTHRQLLREVWGPGHVEQTHYLRVYLAQLRRKIEPEPGRPRLLLTEPGVGYRLRSPE